MKTLSKKLTALSTTDTLRNLSISLVAVAVVAVMLYVLINSPA